MKSLVHNVKIFDRLCDVCGEPIYKNMVYDEGGKTKIMEDERWSCEHQYATRLEWDENQKRYIEKKSIWKR